MRRLLAASMMMALLACGRTSSDGDADRAGASTDAAIVDSLLGWAAGDFRIQRGPKPLRFRNVRSGSLATDGGERQYRLCGEYSPTSRADGEWIPFATIRTSPYEQWIGGQAQLYCNDPAMRWDGADLSSRMLGRFTGDTAR